MSIATGEPRGRVTIIREVQGSASHTRVLTFKREDVVVLAYIPDAGNLLLATYDSPGLAITIGSCEHVLRNIRDPRSIARSILHEDVDVIWTETADGWTRVPDIDGT